MGRTVLFGGTFNPFHNGHLEIVKALLGLDNVGRVVVIPTATPPHKSALKLVSGEHRINMCRLAVADYKNVTVSDIELRRGGRSYTYDTVMEMKRLFKEDISISCGADMVTTLKSWYKYEELIKEAGIIAFRRTGIDNRMFDTAVDNIRADGGKVEVVDCDITDISSSRVRQGAKDDVPKVVLDYMKKNGLYGE